MTPSLRLADFERAFADALLADPLDAPSGGLTSQPGFAVYRNTVLRGCIDALAANHPTVLQLVGVAWFEAAAAPFARAHPPHDGSLARYGDGFAEHLAALAADADLPYLADVARLDRLWTESHLAADAPVLRPASLVTLSADALAAAVLLPHPAARWTRIADVPAFTIWRRHRDGTPLDAPLAWRGESALFSRPDDAVAWRDIDAVALAFLDACARGLPFGDAADRAIAGASPAGFAAAWPSLLAAGAFTSIAVPAA